MEDPIAPGPAPDPMPPEPPRRWRNLEEREASRRRRMVVFAAVLAVATAWALASTVGWLRPLRRPALVLLGDVTGGPSDLAPIPFAEDDRRALADSGLFPTVAGPAPVDRAFAAVEADEPAGATVVHVSARAWAERSTADRDQFLLRFSKDGAPPKPGRPAEGATLADLFASIGANRAAFVILDVLPPPDDPRLGATPADVGKLVADEASKAVANNPRLAVLASCDAGQRPLASEALGRSVFGSYVERGLRGDADSSGDGRVGALELAAFVAPRVDRWASRVLDTRQTPRLYTAEGQGDIPLALVERRPPGPATLAPAKELPAYPGWLLDGWRGRDAARKAGVDREAPRAFGQVEAALLLAERSWRGKLDEARVRSELAVRLEQARDRIAPTRAIPHPKARSLAQEAAFGASPDPETLKAVREVATKRAVPTPESKPGEVDAANTRLIADFAATAKIPSDFDLADAVFRVAAEGQAPGRDAIAFLDRLLLARQPRPAYVETLALHRLAGVPTATWSPETARLALALARRGEAVQARPLAVFGSTGPLDDADRLCHEAEVLLASPGYAKAGEVDRRLVSALAATDSAAALASTVEEARRLRDQATGTLPVATPLLDLDGLERAWFAAAGSAGDLADLVAGPPGGGEARPLEGLAVRSESLRAQLAPFAPPAIAARAGRLTRAAAVLGPADLREVEALLATPLPLAEQRAALWKVGIDLERRLAEAVLALDARAGAVEPARPSDAGSSPVDRLAATSKALLGLSGSGDVGWAGLMDFASEGGPTAGARDRASRLAWPWEGSPKLDDPATDPTRLRRLDEFAALRPWLARRYAFEGRDPDRSEFFAEAAVDFEAAGDPPVASLAIEATPASASLDPEHPELVIRLKLRAASPPDRATVEVATADDDWLDVKLGPPGSKATTRFVVPLGAGSAEVPLAIALRPESDATRAPIPPGVLVRARWGSRAYHRRIPLRIEPGSRRPRLIFAASPTGSEPVASEVRIRATEGKASYSIFVQNPGGRDRRFAVELGDRRGPIAGASATVAAKAGETARVSFGPPPANPGAGVVDVLGPLTLRMADLDDPGFRLVRTIPVGLASPSDCVRVVSAVYTPPGSAGGEKPRLEFRLEAAESLAGPPCPVELSLPADRIPGLISAGEGTFKARLEKPGDVAILFAEDFELDPRGDEWGHVHLAVDGVERALVYRTRFARRGAPSVPVLDLRPAVRLKAARVALSAAPLKVDVEVDSPPEPGRLRLAFGQYTPTGPDDRFRADSATSEDPSRGRIRLDPRGPGGALVFEATVRESSITLDAGKVRGRRIIRARLEDERGDVRASDELPLVFDDRAPAAVAFDSPPKYGLKGGTVTLRATGKVPDSGIKEVAFFPGRPVDGKRPAGVAVVLGKPVGPGREAWSAALPLVDAKPGPLEVSVEFVAGVGPSRFDTATIAVVEAIPVEPGKIKGTVREGSRPQPGLEVRVYDDKGAEKGKATTNDEGQFEVANLAPGAYEVVGAKATPPTKGTAKATVKAGSTAEVEIPMYRFP